MRVKRRAGFWVANVLLGAGATFIVFFRFASVGIVVINNSGVDIEDIEVVHFDEKRIASKYRIGKLAMGEKSERHLWKSDLYLDSVSFVFNGDRLLRAIPALATPTESIVLSIERDGDVTAKLEPHGVVLESK